MGNKQRWQDWVNLFLGAWLFLSPFFGFGSMKDVASWNSYIFGAIVFASSGIALYTPRLWEEWLNVIVGLWLIASPFALIFSTHHAATLNDVVVGILIFISAIWAGSVQPPRSTLEHAHKA